MPEDVNPTAEEGLSFDELQGMLKGKEQADEYLFPGMPHHKIQMRVLTKYELNMCDKEGRRKVKKAVKNTDGTDGEFTQDMLVDFIMYEVLYRAVLKSGTAIEDDKKFFSSSEGVSKLTVEQYEKLLEHYNETQLRYSPLEKAETEEDFEKLLEEIKKKSDPWKSLSTLTLRKLLVYLVNLLETSPKDSGSTSSQSKQSEETSKTDISKKHPMARVKESKLEAKANS